MRAALTTALALWLMPFAALAGTGEETGLRTLATADDSRGWEAVGRIDIGTQAFCTGALIAPDIVLTAAHCLFDPDTRNRVADGDIAFLAGFRNGRATAYRGVRASVVHPDYVYTGPEGADHVARDVALLALDRPIRNGSVTPFAVGARPRKGAELSVVSYAHDRATRPSIQELCHVLGRPAGMLVTSCEADFGTSGAPIFVVEDGAPRIVSVVSAKARVAGRRVSLGTRLSDGLDGLRGRLAAAAQARPVASGAAALSPPAGTAHSAQGAKFLRP